MLRQSSFLLIGAALVLALASPARAASFDCNKATAKDEIAVCQNPLLSGLDSEMGGLWYAYSQFPFLMGANAARRDEAQDFLKRRAACGSTQLCLQGVYRARIQSLRDDIKSAIDGMQKQIDAAQKR